MTIISIYGIFYSRNANFYAINYENNSSVMLGFNENPNSFEMFLEVLSKKNLVVNRRIYPN